MIEAGALDDIMAFVDSEGGDANVIPKLRERWPGMHFTHCLEDELCLEEPVREGKTANVYVVDGSGHCMKIIKDPEHATGLLIAELDE